MGNILKNSVAYKHRRNEAILPMRMTRKERRRQLIEAAATIFSQKGFSGSTTKEIAAKACITEALIFRHFNSKDELFDAVITDKFDELETSDLWFQMREAADRNEDAAVFSAAAKIILHRYQSKHDILRILIFAILERRTHVVERFENQLLPLREFLVGYINKRRTEGYFRTDNAELTAFGFLGVVAHNLTLAELIGNERIPANHDDAIRFYTKIFLDSLRRDRNPEKPNQ